MGAAAVADLPTGFARLWAGQTVSGLGAEISLIAIPLLAATTLGATATQIGGLTAAALLPWLLALPLGAWIDRIRVKPVVIAAELTRAAATFAIPAAWALDSLSLPLLYATAAVSGLAGVCFDTGFGAALPRYIPSTALLTANSRLAAAKSATSIAGPGVGGILVRVIGAPLALLADTFSYLVSAYTVWRALPADRTPARPAAGETFAGAIRAGLRHVWSNPALRALAIQAGIWNAVSGASQALFVLYALHTLGLDAGGIGILLAIGGAGALAGAAAIPALLRRTRFGPTYVLLVAVAIAGMLLLATPHLVTVAVGELLIGVGVAATSVQAVSLRQNLTPTNLFARMLATYRLVSFGTIPLGSLLGGALGDAIGIRSALLAAAIIASTALIPLLLSPIRTMKTLPTKGTA